MPLCVALIPPPSFRSAKRSLILSLVSTSKKHKNSSLINICGKEGLPDAALELMRQMTEEERIAPNAITYNALVHAVAGGGTSAAGDTKLTSPVHGEEEKIEEEEGGGGGGMLANQKREGKGRRRDRRWNCVMPLIEEMRAAG